MKKTIIIIILVFIYFLIIATGGSILFKMYISGIDDFRYYAIGVSFCMLLFIILYPIELENYYYKYKVRRRKFG